LQHLKWGVDVVSKQIGTFAKPRRGYRQHNDLAAKKEAAPRAASH